MRNLLDKTMPLVHPVVAMTVAALFVPMHTGDGKLTSLLPTKAAPQGAPKGRIEESFMHRNHKRRVIVRAGPGRVFAVGSGVDRGYAVRTVQVAPWTPTCVSSGPSYGKSSLMSAATSSRCNATRRPFCWTGTAWPRGSHVIPPAACDRPCPWDQAMWPYRFPLSSL